MTSEDRPAGTAWRALRRDPILVVTLAVFLVSLVIEIVLPDLATLSTAAFFVMVVLVAAALRHRRRATARQIAGDFWTDLSWAIGIWVVVDGALLAAAHLQWPSLALAARFLGALAWLAVWLAASRHPHKRGFWRPLAVERRLHLAGALVVGIGSAIYLIAAPALSRGLAGVAVQSWLMLLVFGVLVSGKLVTLAFQATTDRWRWVYGLLALATSTVALSHYLAAGSTEPSGFETVGGPWSLIATALLLLAVRLDEALANEETEDSIGDPVKEGPHQLETPYLALAIGVPLGHYLGYRLGMLDPDFESFREKWMLLWAATLGAVSIYQQRRLEQWMRRTLDERSRLERSLQSSQRRLQLMDEKRKAEKALVKSKEKYAKAFRASPWAVVLTTLEDGRHLDCNELYLDIIGYEREEVIGKSVLELGIWAHAEDRGRLVETLRQEGRVRNLEISFKRRDGEIRPALVSAERLEIDGEQCLISVSRDLGALKAEEDRQEALEKLLDGLPQAVLLLDLSDQVQSLNAAAEALAGSTSPEKKGQAVTTLTWVADPVHLAQALRATAETGFWTGTLEIKVQEEDQESQAWLTLVKDRLGLPSGKLLVVDAARSELKLEPTR